MSTARDQLLDRGAERRILSGEPGQGIVDQLHRVRREFDDVLHGVQRLEQRRKAADPEHPPPRPAGQLERQLAEEGECALRTHEQFSH